MARRRDPRRNAAGLGEGAIVTDSSFDVIHDTRTLLREFRSNAMQVICSSQSNGSTCERAIRTMSRCNGSLLISQVVHLVYIRSSHPIGIYFVRSTQNLRRCAPTGGKNLLRFVTPTRRKGHGGLVRPCPPGLRPLRSII